MGTLCPFNPLNQGDGPGDDHSVVGHCDSPRKRDVLVVYAYVPLLIEPNPHNVGYLHTKRQRLGHLLSGRPLQADETAP